MTKRSETEIDLSANAEERKRAPPTLEQLARFKQALSRHWKPLEHSGLSEIEKNNFFAFALNEIADRLDEIQAKAPTNEELEAAADRATWWLLYNVNDAAYDRIHAAVLVEFAEEVKLARLKKTIQESAPSYDILQKLSVSERTFFEHIRELGESIKLRWFK